MRNISHIVNDVLPELQQLEQDRLIYRARHRTYLMIGIIPLAVLLVGGLLSGLIFVTFPIAIVWFIISGILYYFKAGKLGNAYRDSYKASVLPPLIQAVDPNLKYDAKLGI